MKFSEVAAQTIDWLKRDGRVSYRALKREFDLDDEFIEDLKAEIIDAKRLAIDEDGKVLVWAGALVEPETEKRRNGETEKDKPEVLPPQSPIPNLQPLAERRQL